LISGLGSGDRRSLAKAITLVESRNPVDRALTKTLLQGIKSKTGGAYRLGITGSPGVGKSSFIERFGGSLVAEGKKLCVLSIDPTSARSGGSLLGDKTRMTGLSQSPLAFIRPSPSGFSGGGVGRATAQAVLLAEAWGADVVIVETVGVGQTEHAARFLVDYLLLLVEPGGGDELQGMKRGIVELVDGVAINKCDGDRVRLAQSTAHQYEGALRLLGGNASPEVRCVSAETGDGISELWQAIVERRAEWEASGSFQGRRAEQRQKLFQLLAERVLVERFFERSEVASKHQSLLEALEQTPIFARGPRC
jgi:LAO/AO transport system kinase